MDIILSNSSDKPIYEQIASQVKAQILSGTLAAGAKLPSIRALASDLGVSVITTKTRLRRPWSSSGLSAPCRARAALSPRATKNSCAKTSSAISKSYLRKAASQAETLGVTRDKLHEMLDLVAPETMQ